MLLWLANMGNAGGLAAPVGVGSGGGYPEEFWKPRQEEARVYIDRDKIQRARNIIQDELDIQDIMETLD